MVPRTLVVVLLIVFAGGMFASATQGPLRGSVTTVQTSTVTNSFTHTSLSTETSSVFLTTTRTETATGSAVTTTAIQTSVSTSTVTSPMTQTTVQTTTQTTSTTKTVTSAPTTMIAVSPNYGCAGTITNATVVGDGFTAGFAVDIFFNSSLVGSTVAGSHGSFSKLVSINNSATGSYTILAADALGLSVTTTYTIFPGPAPC